MKVKVHGVKNHVQDLQRPIVLSFALFCLFLVINLSNRAGKMSNQIAYPVCKYKIVN